MDQTLITLIIKQILETVRDKLASQLALDIDEGHQNEKGTLEIINTSLNKYLTELPKVDMPKPAPVASTSHAPPAANGTPAPATRTASKAVSSDVMKDDKGNPIKCAAVVKKTGAPCKNSAKHNISGVYLCGLHCKSANNAQPDASKKPGGSAKTPAKNTSSFTTAMGVSSMPAVGFSAINIDADADIPDLGDDAEEEL